MANRAGTAKKAEKRVPRPPRRQGGGSFPGPREALTPAAGQRHSKVSGNLRERLEHYLRLARAAASANDMVKSENHYQHAEHYLRLINKQAAPDKPKTP